MDRDTYEPVLGETLGLDEVPELEARAIAAWSSIEGREASVDRWNALSITEHQKWLAAAAEHREAGDSIDVGAVIWFAQMTDRLHGDQHTIVTEYRRLPRALRMRCRAAALAAEMAGRDWSLRHRQRWGRSE